VRNNASTVRASLLKTGTTNGADANSPAQSGPVREGVPFVITHHMRRELHGLGYSDEAIRSMTPAHAQRLLEGAKAYSEPIDDLMPGAEIAL
jgi:hypothetical protein